MVNMSVTKLSADHGMGHKYTLNYLPMSNKQAILI